ncbi:MAG: phosphate signaling complex protein PhoU [Roseiflexaceae bacterium]
MRMRDRYLKELEELHTDLKALGELVVVAITQAVDALVQQDVAAAELIVAADRHIDAAQLVVEEHTLIVMATQQPIAGDLRRLVAAIGIASELERIGDYAKSIAKITIRNADLSAVTSLVDLPQMAQGAITMLRDVLDAFVQSDATVGQRLSDADDRVDELRRHIRADLTAAMQRDPAIVPQAVDLLFVAHHLERIADRTTNIAERLVFMVSGEVIELNP